MDLRVKAFLAGVVAVALGGCATFDQRPAEQIVQERAQARWNLVLKSDIRGAYEYLSPGSRAVMTSEQYASSLRLGFWKAVKVEKVVCETQSACDAHLTIDYEFQGRPVRTPAKETWVKEGSTWWYLRK
jgi:hypothetical protein